MTNAAASTSPVRYLDRATMLLLAAGFVAVPAGVGELGDLVFLLSLVTFLLARATDFYLRFVDAPVLNWTARLATLSTHRAPRPRFDGWSVWGFHGQPTPVPSSGSGSFAWRHDAQAANEPHPDHDGDGVALPVAHRTSEPDLVTSPVDDATQHADPWPPQGHTLQFADWMEEDDPLDLDIPVVPTHPRSGLLGLPSGMNQPPIVSPDADRSTEPLPSTGTDQPASSVGAIPDPSDPVAHVTLASAAATTPRADAALSGAPVDSTAPTAVAPDEDREARLRDRLMASRRRMGEQK